MTLSCECDLSGDHDWYYSSPDDYTTLQTKLRRRCKSCNTPIDIGAVCTKFEITRPTNCAMEEAIYGDERTMAPMFHCEACADIYFNLVELGFKCIMPNEDMRKLLKEYHEVYGKGIK